MNLAAWLNIFLMVCMYFPQDACLRCQSDGKQEECIGKQLCTNGCGQLYSNEITK